MKEGTTRARHVNSEPEPDEIRATTPPEQHGQSPDPGEEFHLGKAVEQELKRLVTHPIKERRRLRAELDEGQTAGLAVLLGGIAFWVWLLAVLLMVVVFVVAYLVT